MQAANKANVTATAWSFAIAFAFIAAPLRGQITLKAIEADPLKIDSGLVSGSYLASGVKAYFGIPFAAPPVRENRWRAAQPVKPWTGVLTANRLQPECVQGLRSATINHYFGEETASEDCLYLNVWAPRAARAGAHLPVVVWIYGGGFTQGSSGNPLYSGESLAKKGVVFVSFNYRLGVFGFLAHPAMTRESDRGASGDWGFLDQVAALQWVSRNISIFGGDARNVTLMGQSAGSMSINDLQASPLAKGLFQRAIGLSGSTLTGGVASGPLADAEAQGLKLQSALKADSLAAMRTFSSDKVTAATAAAGVRTGPVVDGYFLSKPPSEIFEARQQNDVAVLTGATANDIGTNLPIRNARTLDEYREAAKRMFGADADKFLSLYPAANDEEARAAAQTASMEAGFGLGARDWARAQAASGSKPAWLYRFSRTHPYAEGVVFSDHDPKTAGAYHAGDISYWLQTQDAFNLFRVTRNWTPWDRELAREMSDIVIAFARTGNPSTTAVTMIKYDPRDERLVDFGDAIRVVKLNSNGMDFMASHPAGRGGAGRGGARN